MWVRKEDQGHMQVYLSLPQNAIKTSAEEFVHCFISNFCVVLNHQYQYRHMILHNS